MNVPTISIKKKNFFVVILTAIEEKSRIRIRDPKAKKRHESGTLVRITWVLHSC
jgi:hypothetical protein